MVKSPGSGLSSPLPVTFLNPSPYGCSKDEVSMRGLDETLSSASVGLVAVFTLVLL